ncbi:MAG TPA: SpoIIE family protein phosphatase [Kiritimatiellia bacterium]|nr:SpoIIE family protein phosphatase [Kiritimatiellia bacterium]
MKQSEALEELTVGMTRRWWTGYLLVILGVSLPFAFLFKASHQSLINEIRHHAKGVAIAVAAGIDPEQFELIRTEADMETEAYRTIQRHLDRVSVLNPDVLFVYTMRKPDAPFVPKYETVFVVDQSARDLDGNGVIDRHEMSELPGATYDARLSPELVMGFEGPTADLAIRPDPPYPDSLSGYAPILSGSGEVIGLVGADISAATIQAKMRVMHVTLFGVWGLLLVLAVLLTGMSYRQREAFQQNRLMSLELSRRNEMLRAANEELARIQETGAMPPSFQDVSRRGLIRPAEELTERVIVDQYYMASAHPGGDFCDVFDLDDDRIGVYLAHVTGMGVSAALMAGTLKLCMKLVKGDVPRHAGGTFYANLHRPESLMHSLNHFLRAEMPECDFVTMVYGVLDLVENQLTYITCGHPYPLLVRRHSGEVKVLKDAHHPALGIEADQTFLSGQVEVGLGDRLVFVSRGLLDSQDVMGGVFGLDRLVKLLSMHAGESVTRLTEVVKSEVAMHRGGSLVRSDYSFLVIEVK